jgi:hypothetical protein
LRLKTKTAVLPKLKVPADSVALPNSLHDQPYEVAEGSSETSQPMQMVEQQENKTQ